MKSIDAKAVFLVAIVILGIVASCFIFPYPIMILDLWIGHAYDLYWPQKIEPVSELLNSNAPYMVDLSNTNIEDTSWVAEYWKLIKYDDRDFNVECENEKLEIYGKHIDQNTWIIEVLMNDDKLFDQTISSTRWKNDDPFLSTSAFSPTCDQIFFTFHGWVSYEYFGKEELWLFDLSSRSIEFILDGRKPAFQNFDESVQFVRPRWSPEGDEIVFGDKYIGLEIYNLQSKKRRWLLDSEYSGSDPSWSSTGNWIVSSYRDYIVAVTPDSKYFTYHTLNECENIFGKEWSDISDTLAIYCYTENYEDEIVWIWDLPSLTK